MDAGGKGRPDLHRKIRDAYAKFSPRIKAVEKEFSQKYGCRDGAPDDLLVVREGGSQSLRWLEGTRVEAGPVHGTGCALSSAIAAYRARGDALPAAVERGRRFVAKALEGAAQAGSLARLLAYF